MIRHMKEVHRYTKINLDYAAIDSDIVRCTECDETFSRETNLKRHEETVHASSGQDFSRKDTLTSHMKKKMCKIWSYL